MSKLSLNRETLRLLGSEETQGAVGAFGIQTFGCVNTLACPTTGCTVHIDRFTLVCVPA